MKRTLAQDQASATALGQPMTSDTQLQADQYSTGTNSGTDASKAPGAGDAMIAAATAPSAPAWVLGVMQKLKGITLEAEKLHLRASADAAVAHRAAREASARATTYLAALEARTAEWQVAEVARQRLQRLASRRAAQASSQAVELAAGLQSQVDSLHDQLAQASKRGVEAAAEAASSAAAASEAQARAEALEHQLELVGAEAKELRARLGAAQIELAACTSATGSPGAPVLSAAQMKAHLHGQVHLPQGVARWMEELVSRLGLRPDHRDKVMALMREVRSHLWLQMIDAPQRQSMQSAQVC